VCHNPRYYLMNQCKRMQLRNRDSQQLHYLQHHRISLFHNLHNRHRIHQHNMLSQIQRHQWRLHCLLHQSTMNLHSSCNISNQCQHLRHILTSILLKCSREWKHLFRSYSTVDYYTYQVPTNHHSHTVSKSSVQRNRTNKLVFQWRQRSSIRRYRNNAIRYPSYQRPMSCLDHHSSTTFVLLGYTNQLWH